LRLHPPACVASLGFALRASAPLTHPTRPQAQLQALQEAEAELLRREAADSAPAGPPAARGAPSDAGKTSGHVRKEAPAPPATPPPPPPATPADTLSVVDQLREEGNAFMRAGDAARAAELYTEALRPAATGVKLVAHACLRRTVPPAPALIAPRRCAGVNRQMTAAAAAMLYSNRAAARLALRDWEAAAADAQAAVTLQPAHVKALRRLATAHCELGNFRLAVKACRAGEAALAASGDRSCAFQPLLEQARMALASERLCTLCRSLLTPCAGVHRGGAARQRGCF
jgi:tetratricopeptide (TPR) repeat protein